MKTLEQLYSYKSESFDGRDIGRLAYFFPVDKLEQAGFGIKEEAKADYKPEEYTRENILIHLKSDLSFAFEKALNKRGLSAGCMHDVVCMWNWVLEEGLENFDEYAQYGLPTLKVTALKYGFDNPIGNDVGNEYKYSSEGE